MDPADIRKASLRGQIHTELSPQELQNVAQRERISVEQLKKTAEFDPYFNLKVVLVEEAGQLKNRLLRIPSAIHLGLISAPANHRPNRQRLNLDKQASFGPSSALMKTTIRSLMASLTVLFLSAVVPTAQAVIPPPDGGYPNFNTAEGTNALRNLTTGAANTAVGWYSLFSDTDASFNTATGAGTLLFNTADGNTAFGTAALLFNTSGNDNTALGTAALLNNTTGTVNTAVGTNALRNNTDGHFNTAVGEQALVSNLSGQENTAIGYAALANHPTGNSNTAVGTSALLNVTGAQNTAIGAHALQSNETGNNNTAIGNNTLLNSTGSGNIALGQNAGAGVTTANNVTCIGTSGANVDGSCFIGRIYTNVQPIVGTDPDSVTITSTGRLGRGNVSSRRYKHDIQPMDRSSEALFSLQPVSFRYNKEYDATQTLAFGLIAEDVAKVYPDLVGRNSKGEPESVRYEQINTMLLNEFLKEHRKVEKLEATVAELAAQLQKLTARMETNDSDARVAAIDR